jgi:hypothetical protein
MSLHAANRKMRRKLRIENYASSVPAHSLKDVSRSKRYHIAAKAPMRLIRYPPASTNDGRVPDIPHVLSLNNDISFVPPPDGAGTEPGKYYFCWFFTQGRDLVQCGELYPGMIRVSGSAETDADAGGISRGHQPKYRCLQGTIRSVKISC